MNNTENLHAHETVNPSEVQLPNDAKEDLVVYGNAFVDEHGNTVDPTTVKLAQKKIVQNNDYLPVRPVFSKLSEMLKKHAKVKSLRKEEKKKAEELLLQPAVRNALSKQARREHRHHTAQRKVERRIRTHNRLKRQHKL